MPMASRRRKHQLTTFTSIGSQESLDKLGLDCGHGWSPEPSIFCKFCSCNLCLECYQSHNRYFHSSITQSVRKDTKHIKHVSQISVEQDILNSETSGIKGNKNVLNVPFELETEPLYFNRESDDANVWETKSYQTEEKNCDSSLSGQTQRDVNRQTEVLPTNFKKTLALHVADICCDPIPKPTRITGIILIDNKLIATDFSKKCIKVIETDHYQMLSERSFTTGPWDLTEVNKGQIAVTLTNDKKIVFLRLNQGKLSLEREIVTNGYCDGIACHNNTLVVTFVNPANLQILDLHGNHLQNFNNQVGLFQEPRHVAISHDGLRLYVSDFQKNEVICVTVDGQVLNKYTSNELQGPEKLALDEDGGVFVCGSSSNSIHRISAQCENMFTILTENDGLRYPQSLCCCLATKKLYIGMDGEIGIKVFALQENMRNKKKKNSKRDEQRETSNESNI